MTLINKEVKIGDWVKIVVDDCLISGSNPVFGKTGKVVFIRRNELEVTFPGWSDGWGENYSHWFLTPRAVMLVRKPPEQEVMKYKVTITQTANGQEHYMQIISEDQFSTNIVLIGQFEVKDLRPTVAALMGTKPKKDKKS